MNIKEEITRVEGELFELYRGGSTNVVRITQLWNRFEQLEKFQEGATA